MFFWERRLATVCAIQKKENTTKNYKILIRNSYLWGKFEID